MSSSEETEEEDILPAKSKAKYIQAYDNFMKWKTENNQESFSQNMFLSYFEEVSKYRKVTSLWAIYSMLKKTLQVKHSIRLNDNLKLLAWLKKKSVGYQSAQSRILTKENIKKFIYEAPDVKYLAIKVALIVGVSGACQASELTNLTTNSIQTVGDIMICTVRHSEGNNGRIFSIRDEFIPVVKKYQELRPKDINTDRFFISYRNGCCQKQVIGRHTMGTLPKKIAEYLKLPNPELYSGRCFKRSAAAFGAIVTNKVFEAPSNSGENEFEEMGTPSKRVNVNDRELENLLPEIPVEIGDIGLTADAVQVKVEDMELADEVYIKTKEDGTTEFYPMMTYDAANNMATTSRPPVSDSDKESRSTDFAMDSDEDDKLEDIVHIKSENVDQKTTLRSLQEETSQEMSSPHDTKITVAGKNITILFKNCTNVGNVTVNIINK